MTGATGVSGLGASEEINGDLSYVADAWGFSRDALSICDQKAEVFALQ